MSTVLFALVRGTGIILVVFLLLSLYQAQGWIKGAVELKRSGALEIVRQLAKDYGVKGSDIYGLQVKSKKKEDLSSLYFFSGASGPDFGTVNYAYGRGAADPRVGLKPATEKKDTKVTAYKKSQWSVVWQTTESAPPCCQGQGSGPVHTVDSGAAKGVLAKVNSGKPGGLNFADFGIFASMAASDKAGILAATATKATDKWSLPEALSVPGRFVVLPTLVLAPAGYVAGVVQAGQGLVGAALLFLGYLALKRLVLGVTVWRRPDVRRLEAPEIQAS